MLRKLALFCALIGIVAFVAGSAYAEVQNIRVSGDIEALAVYRNNYDLEGKRWTDAQSSYLSEDQHSFLMSVTRLQVDADLTDNVAACVRLANLRDWDSDNHTSGVDESSIILDLANVSLKEMLYSPLTLIIGRQELNFGDGLIVGNGLYQDPNNSIRYNELGNLNGYDAVRAILDYDPLTIDVILAKMEEQDDISSTRDEDVDLYGVNLGYKFDSYDAEMEAYYFFKRDADYDLAVDVLDSPYDQRVFGENSVYTFGLRGSLTPMENLSLRGEIAGQLGDIVTESYTDSVGPNVDDDRHEVDREAMAANVAASYTLADVKFMPTLGVEYLYTSGEEAGVDGDFEAWDPMYRGKVMGNIRDYLENLYTTTDSADTSGLTNQHTIKAMGSLDLGELVDGLSLDLAYLHYWFDEEPIAEADDDVGDELNMTIAYDYTDDVRFALDSAVFLPGDYYDSAKATTQLSNGGMNTGASAQAARESNDPAISVVGSCKVTF